jgi:Ca2+-binding RTX toxin-like protein
MNLFRRGVRRKRLSIVAFAGTLVAYQALALIGAGPAAAAFAGTCTFTSGAIAVQLAAADNPYFSANGADEITIDGTNTSGACTTPTNATLTNTTSITVSGNTGDEEVGIDLSVDWGTINWSINLLTGTADDVWLDGSGVAAADAIDVVAGASGIDLTNDGDLDATVSGTETLFVDGSPGDDSISGSGSTITGGPTTVDMDVAAAAGDDSIASGGGNDTIDGGAGEDVVDYSASTAAITGTINGLFNGMGVDTTTTIEDVVGSAQGDTLNGDAGPNWITPGAGDDKVDGAAGEDTIDFSDSAAAVTVDVDAGTATGDGADTFSNVEDVSGSDLGDTITGDDTDNVLDGGAGNDAIGGGGGPGGDTLIGGGGSDWADYSWSTDPVTLVLNHCAVDGTGTITGLGVDTIQTMENATLTTGDDSFTGNEFSNGVQPNGGQNSLTGDSAVVGCAASGGDSLDYSVGYEAGVTVNLAGGGTGDDAASGFENIVGTAFADNFTGNDDSNTIKSRKGSDNVRSGAGDDTVKAGAGNDLVRAGTGDDDLWGQKGNDSLNGGKGSDFCKGGPGKDVLKSCESGHK